MFTIDDWNSFHSLQFQMSIQLEPQAEVRKGLLDKFAVKSDVAKLCETSWAGLNVCSEKRRFSVFLGFLLVFALPENWLSSREEDLPKSKFPSLSGLWVTRLPRRWGVHESQSGYRRMDGHGHYQHWGDGLVPSASFDLLQFLNEILQLDTKTCASECVLCSGSLAGRQIFLGGLNETWAWKDRGVLCLWTILHN